MLSTPLAVRLAVRLQAVWQIRLDDRSDWTNAWHRFDTQVADLHRAHQRREVAERFAAGATAAVLDVELRARLDDLAARITALRWMLEPSAFLVPDLRDWVADLRQLDEEFGELTVNWQTKTLRVVTDPVVLDDVGLGPFAIVLAWDRVGRAEGAGCFDVTALDPRPAAGRPDVHHPHVDGRRLCPGDAADALDHAIEHGRLVDAFLVVRSVLSTSNPRSAYAPLDAWDGTTCSDCGRVVVQDDRYSCEGCEIDLCDQCSGSCTVCSTTRCSGCLQRCPVCEDGCCPGCLLEIASGRSVCPTCRTTCGHCGETVATDEVVEGTGCCAGCDAKTVDEYEPSQSPTPDRGADRCDVTMTSPGG